MDLNFLCHHLNVSPSVILKKQPPRCSSKEHSKTVKEEVVKFKRVEAKKRSLLPRMVGQNGGDEKEEWEVANVCRFHRFKHSLPQGPLPNTLNRPVGGRDSRSSLDEFFGCLSGVPSDTISSD